MFLRKKSKGQSLVEYSLILVLVAIACVGALQGVTGGITGALARVTAALG